MTEVMEMVFAESGTRGITSSKFRYLYLRECRRVTVGGMERFELGRGVKVDFNGDNNVNGQDRIYASMDCVPGTPYHIRVQEQVWMFKGCT